MIIFPAHFRVRRFVGDPRERNLAINVALVQLTIMASLLWAVMAHAQTVTYYDTGEEFVGPFPSWKNVKTVYGARGDGKADDTAAIQKALNDMRTVASNDWCVLYFPAGTYRITKTLSTFRTAEHDDYLGSNLVGEDPATTILLWDGASATAQTEQPMLRYDSWNCKVSRLTFDGRGKASGGLVRAGSFSTRGEHSDLVFKDIIGVAMQLGNNQSQGIAETAVLRCKFIRCNEGISTINWNSLDIYVWYCLFQDCGKGIYNRMGGYQAYENVFLRSREFDVGSMNNMVFAFVNNTSIGSRTFLQGVGQYVRGNKVYNTTESVALNVGSDLVLLDNTFCSKPGVIGAVAYCGASTMAIGNTFTVAQQPIRPKPSSQQDLKNALDNNPATDFIDNDCNRPSDSPVQPGTIQWNAAKGGARTVVKYTLTSGNNPKFDPQDFQLMRSDSPGGPWTVLDTQQGLKWETRQEKKEFAIQNHKSYGVYRLTITANATGIPGLQMAGVEFLDDKGTNITQDPTCLMTGRNEWGQFYSLDQKIVDRAKLPVPATVRLPGTPRNLKRKILEVKKGTGDDAKELQARINAAAQEPAGSKPVVHIPKGTYTFKQTVTVPALGGIQIIGDGVGNGTVIAYGGGLGPILRFVGPSRATLRDLEIRAGGANGAEAVVVENADQPGGRIYTEQVYAGGNGDDRYPPCTAAFHVDGLDKSDVTMICGNFSSCLSGVQARGGPTLARSGRTKNQVIFLCGSSDHACRLLDVTDGGKLLGETFWYEADFAYPAALIDLSPSSFGKITLAGAALHMNTLLQPIVSVNGFHGVCTILSTQLDGLNEKAVTPCVQIKGDGSKATLVSIGNTFTRYGNTWPVAKGWVDQSQPAAQAVMIGSNGSIMNKVPHALPDAALVRRSLEQLRAVRIAPAQDRPAGVTDVKLFRVLLFGGAAKDCIRIQAAKPAP